MGILHKFLCKMKMNKKIKREVDLVVISDVHLGTYGCHAAELANYLKSIKPKHLILNGDILDIWNFKKSYWPKEHMKVIKILLNWIIKGVKITYITGNHDEMLRKFAGFNMHNFSIQNKVVLPIGNEKAWFFHGDVFDVSMQHARWLVKLGGFGYDLLIVLNRAINFVYEKIGREKVSISKRIKNKVKSAVKYINKFEEIASNIAIDNGYNYVICGHIHQPEMKKIQNEKGYVMYLNSGDWVENLTALEYHHNKWKMYVYNPLDFIKLEHIDDDEAEMDTQIINKSAKEIFDDMLKDFELLNTQYR